MYMLMLWYTMMLMYMSHPLGLGMLLVLLSVETAVLINFDAPSSLFTLVIVMTYTGGMLILFLYSCVLSPTPMTKVNKEEGASKWYSGMTYGGVSLLAVVVWSMYYITPFNIKSGDMMYTSNYYSEEWYTPMSYTPMSFWCTFLLVYLGYWGWSQCVLSPTPMWTLY
uniref:NADH dehydrogenase subunit 6 n=1 Tax=Gordionus alpestris TaxID=1137640 RepID=A0A514ABX7_9BILA|nr:NADH dehydrogenase subunit 6 [Gordionus alpestris]QDH52420.1 NADH dehydrogenase subunit 6 [Gordionus alpestris]